MGLSHPILSCSQAISWERTLLGHDEEKVWAAMSRAGKGVGLAILRDYQEVRPLPANLRVLLLAGVGHNAGDSLIAAATILQTVPDSKVDVLFVYGQEGLKPLTKRAWDELSTTYGECVRLREWSRPTSVYLSRKFFHICIDGILGMRFQPPLREPCTEICDWAAANASIFDLRVSVDLPSGISDDSVEGAFQADFTYATGIVKAPVLDPVNSKKVGRLRYVDIGFFDDGYKAAKVNEEILRESCVRKLGGLRNPETDKRHHGHVFLLGGSRSMPGALAMSILASIRSGAGLTTALVPANLSMRLAPIAPEAMWVPLPVHHEGNLNGEEALKIIRRNTEKATAFVMGPGMDPDRDNRYLVNRIVREMPLPTVLDAGALQSDVLLAVAGRPADAAPVVLTPHQGEFKRLCGEATGQYDRDLLIDFCRRHRAITVLKGPVTHICDGERVVVSPYGGPVLARGGSGDILAGIIGSLISRPGVNVFEATCRAVAWHGLAAEALARSRGHQAVRTTEVLDYLSPALRG